MKIIIRNICAGALIFTVWALILSATWSMAVAEEIQPDIKLVCNITEEETNAIILRPEGEYGPVGKLKSITKDTPATNGLLIKFPEEYLLVVQTPVGYDSHYINRMNLKYHIITTINTVGKSMKTGGFCKIYKKETNGKDTISK